MSMCLCPWSKADTVTLPYTFVAGTQLPAYKLNACYQTIYNEFNGNITDTNIKNTAAIALSKLGLNPGTAALNQRTTGNVTWCAGILADTQPRISLNSDGSLGFGPGGVTVLDTHLFRDTGPVLKLMEPTHTTYLGMLVGPLTAHSLTLSVTPLGVASGGTGLASYTAGDLITATGATTLASLAKGTANQVLGMDGTATSQEYKTITAGAGITVTPAAGSITIASTTTGTVTSVALTMPSIFSVAGSPVTTSGTLAVTAANQTANTVYAGPASGVPASPSFRVLTSADIAGTVSNYGPLTITASTMVLMGCGWTVDLTSASTVTTWPYGTTVIVRGGVPYSLTTGLAVTAAEFVAGRQQLLSGAQTLTINGSGVATAGTLIVGGQSFAYNAVTGISGVLPSSGSHAIDYYLQCSTTEGNYPVGAKIYSSSLTTAGDFSLADIPDSQALFGATNGLIIAVFGSYGAAGKFKVPHFTTYAATTLTNANWRVYVNVR